MDDSEQSTTVVEDSTGDVSVKKRSRKKARYAQILKQMEFYFSDANLSRDRFMAELLTKSKDVPLEVFLTFNKIRELTCDTKEIAKALGSSQLLQVSEDRTTVSRTTEVQRKENQDDCIIYVEQLPPDANHEWVSGIFSAYGKVEYVAIPKFKSKPVIKGFAFVEFDTPEAAKKALEAFGSVGSCLPSQMPPEKLCSIATYEEMNEQEEGVDASQTEDLASEKQKKKATKNKHDSHEFEDDKSQPKSKRVKLDESETIVEEEEGKDDEDKEVSRKKAKKRKIVNEVTDQEQENENVEMCANDETPGKKKKKRKSEEKSNDTEDVDDEGTAQKGKTDDNGIANEEEEAENGGGEEPDESTEEASSKKKKKNKRRKKHKDKKANKKGEDPTFGLQIMSKYEWQRLRNKYLTLQREKMQALKKLLAKRRYGSVHQSPFSSQESYRQNMKTGGKDKPEKTKVSFTPGVIIKINLPAPLMDTAPFKMDVRLCEDVAYVDVKEGDTEAFLRCFSCDGVQRLLTEHKWGKMTVLEGEEEKKYWEKISEDRKSKLQNKVRVQVRGKDKLMKRAEQELGKHIKFDD